MDILLLQQHTVGESGWYVCHPHSARLRAGRAAQEELMEGEKRSTRSTEELHEGRCRLKNPPPHATFNFFHVPLGSHLGESDFWGFSEAAKQRISLAVSGMHGVAIQDCIDGGRLASTERCGGRVAWPKVLAAVFAFYLPYRC